MKNKWMILVLVLLAGPALNAQPADSTATGKKLQWLAGVEGFSALNALSVIGGVEVNRSRYSISLSHFWNSSRIGVYYDYKVVQRYKVYAGIGLHTSFVLSDFDQSRKDYIDSLKVNDIEKKTTTFAFLPNYGEVRNLYFVSASLSKEFRLYKGLCMNAKVMAVCCMNAIYNKVGFAPLCGLQIYYKMVMRKENT